MAKITHACGHEASYGGRGVAAAKDRKALAAQRCPACEYAARQAAPKVAPVVAYWVAKGLPGTVYTTAGGTPASIEGRIREAVTRDARYWDRFETRDAARDHLASLVRAGTLTIIEDGTEREAIEMAGTFDVIAKISPEERATARRSERENRSSPFDDDIRSMEGNEDL